MISGKKTYETFMKYADSLFPVAFSDYLLMKNRTLWGLRIVPIPNTTSCNFAPLFGNIQDSDMRLFNTRPMRQSLAGFRPQARNVFSSLSEDADIFLLSDAVEAFPQGEIDALVIHELCHWYIDSGLQTSNPVACVGAQRSKAAALHQRTYALDGERELHPLVFCELITAVADTVACRDRKQLCQQQRGARFGDEA